MQAEKKGENVVDAEFEEVKDDKKIRLIFLVSASIGGFIAELPAPAEIVLAVY